MEGMAEGLLLFLSLLCDRRLYAFGAALLVLLALGHDGGAEAGTEVVRQFVKLRVAVNFNGFLGGVANHVAVVAPGEVVLQLDFCRFVEDAV
jgi:hypothetical protein